jgi:molybdenum cofactor cytidylyltransferase
MLLDDLAILILAAGSSSRLGHSKQLLEINGQSLLLKSVTTAIESGTQKIVVVLGANEAAHRKTIEHLPVEIIYNPAWQKGMGSSLKTGLSHLLKANPKTEMVIAMVCDQPLITADHLKNLIKKFVETKSKIVASFYSDSAGVPALFEKSLFEKMLSLGDEQGAKKIIQLNPELVCTVNFPEGAIDIDTEDDIKKFLS